MGQSAKRNVPASKGTQPEHSTSFPTTVTADITAESQAPQKVTPSTAVSGKRRKKGTTALSRQGLDPLWKLLDSKIGGREGLLAVALASSSPKAQTLVELLLDKAYRTAGTKALARKAGFSAEEIVDLFRSRKWLETTLVLHESLPDIVKGATDDAKPRLEPCGECKGSGKAETGDDCWQCRGEGEIRRSGDKDKLTFIGEAVGLVGKRTPLSQVNIQVNSNTQNVSNSFEELLRKAVVKPALKQVEGAIEVESSEETA